MRIAFASLLLVGCLSASPSGPGVVGSPDDITIAPGTYDAYRVVFPCSEHTTDVGVFGTGSIAPATLDHVDELGTQLFELLRDLPSVHAGGGYGVGCEPGVATWIMLDDWRDVDQVIVRTGQWLGDQDLALQVAILVQPIAVPNSR